MESSDVLSERKRAGGIQELQVVGKCGRACGGWVVSMSDTER